MQPALMSYNIVGQASGMPVTKDKVHAVVQSNMLVLPAD